MSIPSETATSAIATTYHNISPKTSRAFSYIQTITQLAEDLPT